MSKITIHTSRTNKVKFEIGSKICHIVTDSWSFESQTDISIRCIPSYYFTITSTMSNRMPKHLLKFAAMQRVLPLSKATGLEVFLDPVQLLHRQLSYTVLQVEGQNTWSTWGKSQVSFMKRTTGSQLPVLFVFVPLCLTIVTNIDFVALCERDKSFKEKDNLSLRICIKDIHTSCKSRLSVWI